MAGYAQTKRAAATGQLAAGGLIIHSLYGFLTAVHTTSTLYTAATLCTLQ